DVLAGDPDSDPCDDLVGDRVQDLGPVLGGGDVGEFLRVTEEDRVFPGFHRVVSHIHNELVHADCSRNGADLPTEEMSAPVGGGAGDPVRVAEGVQCQDGYTIAELALSVGDAAVCRGRLCHGVPEL